MDDHLVVTLWKLRRCRDRLAADLQGLRNAEPGAAAAPRARPAASEPLGRAGAPELTASSSSVRATLEKLWLDLDNARRAADEILSTAARRFHLDATCSRTGKCAPDNPCEIAAEAAVSSISSLADALSNGPQLDAAASATIASEAHSVLTQIAHCLAPVHQQQALRAADEARAAVAAGDPAAAATAALRAWDAAAVAMWAAGAGGLQLVREVAAAQRAVAEAVEALVPQGPECELLPDERGSGGQRSDPTHISSRTAAEAPDPAEAAPVEGGAGGTAASDPVEAAAVESGAVTAAAAAAATKAAAVAAVKDSTAAVTAAPAAAEAAAAAAAVEGNTAAVAEPAAAAEAAPAAIGNASVVAELTIDTGPARTGAVVQRGGATQQRVVPKQDITGSASSSSSSSGREEAGPSGKAPAAVRPGCPTAAQPASRADPLHSASLSDLAGLADRIAPDGGLPADALSRAARICQSLPWMENLVWTIISATGWANPRTRRGLVRLLSCAVHQLLEATDSEGPSSHQENWVLVCTVLLNSAVNALSPLDSSRCTSSPDMAVAVVVAQLLGRTGLAQCLTRLLAVMTPPTAALTAAVADADADVAAAAEHGWAMRALVTAAEARSVSGTRVGPPFVAGLMDMRGQVRRMLQALVVGSCRTDIGLQAATRQLRGALLKSRAMEHLVREAVVHWQHATATCRSAGAAGCDRDVPDGGVTAAAQLVSRAARNISMLAPPLSWVVRGSRADNRPLAVWADAVLSGPCVQFFLLQHAVSQLCAADGGTDYGLPAGARLPAHEAREEDEFVVIDSGSSAASGSNASQGCPSVGPLRLSAILMINAFTWWSRNRRARPCSDRALRAVCERAAAAAIASAVAADGEEAAATAAAAAAASAALSPALQARFWPPLDAAALALAAMDCAVTRTRGGAAGDFRGLWAPVVQTANMAVDERLRSALDDRHSPLRLLLALPLPQLGGILADAGSPLPADPGPDLAAALAAGYVPTLERTIRNEARLAGSSAAQLAPVLRGVQKLLTNSSGLASLMAYGEPIQVAALLATVVKVFTVVAAVASESADDALAGQLTELIDTAAEGAFEALLEWDGRGSGPDDGFWWRRNSGSRAASPPSGSPAAAHPSGGSAAAAAGHSDEGAGSGGTDSGGSGAQIGPGALPLQSLPPLHRLSLLASFTATRWLPALGDIWARGPPACSQAVCSPLLALMPLMQPFLHAYLHCSSIGSQAPVSTENWAAASGCGGSDLAVSGDGLGSPGAAADSADAADGGTTDDDRALLVAAAASWERLLVRELDLPGLAGMAAQAWYDNDETRHDVGSVLTIAMLLLHLLVAFPSQARNVLKTELGSTGGRKAATTATATTSLLDWLLEGMEPYAESVDAAGHVIELAQAVAAGREPGAEDVARLRSAVGLDWAVRLGALLPPPCFVEAALQLPLCTNPRCTNLEGDSEAGMLQAGSKEGGGGGSGGGVSYCSAACHLAHSRSGC